MSGDGFAWLDQKFRHKASIMQLNVEDYDGIKQNCHHLQATSTNRGRHNNRMVKSSIGTTPTLSFTSSNLGQEHWSPSGVLD